MYMVHLLSNLTAIIWIVVIFVIIIKFRSKDTAAAANKKPERKGSGSAAKASGKRGYTNYKPHKDITTVGRQMGDKGSSVLSDDRNNDWLARQLADEHKAFRATSEMFDLKIEHASHCDARLLAQFHARNCDAEHVDTANASHHS